jgi:hypothetical protein
VKFLDNILYKKKITIKEVNKYLDIVVEDLKKKHEKVTHEDFDNELESITGIRWKQVKNYKNHPNPGQEIQDNSKIKFFVFEQRKKDKFFKTKQLIILSSLCIGIAFIIYRLLRPTEVIKEVNFISNTESIIINPKLTLGIPGLGDVQLGMAPDSFSGIDCKNLDLERLLCSKNLPENKGVVSLFFQRTVLTRLTLTTTDQVIYEKIRDSLKNELSKFIKKDENLHPSLVTISYTSEGEKINFSHLSSDVPDNVSHKTFVIELAHVL